MACGAGLKALRLSSNLVWGMSVHAVSEERGLLVDPRAPFSYQLLKLNGSGVISQKAHFTPMCCFKGWDHHEMLSPGIEQRAPRQGWLCLDRADAVIQWLKIFLSPPNPPLPSAVTLFWVTAL